mmetsp:Transcript_37992/g.27978  ORF Transcript_37992/g.27978 Transcript_37992/m.27978 type:complete len:116 (+) Transcript_37992:35-382(+)
MDLPNQVDKMVTDVDKIIELYDYAEKLYPYDNIRPDRKLNEHQQRRNVASPHLKNPYAFNQGNGYYGLLFVYLMSRAEAVGLSDFSPIFKNKLRYFSYFLIAGTIAAEIKMLNRY